MTLKWRTVPAVRMSPCRSVVKVVLWSRGRGAHLTKPGWSKPHAHSNPTNLALFRHKVTLYRFNQWGAHTIAGGLKWEQGAEPSPPSPPHFNHWCIDLRRSTWSPVQSIHVSELLRVRFVMDGQAVMAATAAYVDCCWFTLSEYDEFWMHFLARFSNNV